MFEIELDRQVVQAGDEILGWITVQGEDVESVEVAFQGEEILGANDISHSLVLPVADEKLKLDAKGDLSRGLHWRWIKRRLKLRRFAPG